MEEYVQPPNPPTEPDDELDIAALDPKLQQWLRDSSQYTQRGVDASQPRQTAPTEEKPKSMTIMTVTHNKTGHLDEVIEALYETPWVTRSCASFIADPS